MNPCLTCVDVAWLTASGETFHRIAARLGLQPKSLERHLYRHNRRDLITRDAS